MKNPDRFLSILRDVVIGITCGYGLYAFYDFKTHPEIYAAGSAPWFAKVYIAAGIALLVIFFINIAKHRLKNKNK